MTITIHQPEYLPWIGFFDRIYKSDLFVILDDVQYQKNAFINRNKIKTAQGWQWITIPIKERESLRNINEMLIDNRTDWAKKHWKALISNYNKAPFFKEYASFLRDALKKKWESISELDSFLMKEIMDILGLKAKIEKSSSLNIPGQATERLVNICKKLDADTYLSGPGFTGSGEKHHMDLEKFQEAGIKVIFQEFEHPSYPQQFEEQGFLPYMSIVDLLFNCGEKSLEFIKSGSSTT